MTQWKSIILTSTFLLLVHLCSAQTDSLYVIALKKADFAYGFKNWGGKDNAADSSKFKEAKRLYTIALQIKPNETYPANRIKEIEKTLYDFKTKPVYNTIISKADSLFFADNFTVAKDHYLRADSLYSNNYTKEKLSAIFALINLTKNSSDTILYIKHGKSFGMCEGYCYFETKFTKDSIIKASKSWDKSKTDKADTLKMNNNYWQSMVQAIDLKEFYKLPHTIGCPDCTDGGAEWLIIGTKNSEWKVEFEYGSEIITIKNLLATIKEMK